MIGATWQRGVPGIAATTSRDPRCNCRGVAAVAGSANQDVHAAVQPIAIPGDRYRGWVLRKADEVDLEWAGGHGWVDIEALDLTRPRSAVLAASTGIQVNHHNIPAGCQTRERRLTECATARLLPGRLHERVRIDVNTDTQIMILGGVNRSEAAFIRYWNR